MKVPVLFGGIAGDVIGSKFESFNTRRTDFRLFGKRSRFTDDTVLTVAIADALLSGVPHDVRLREYALRYPDVGYGDFFMVWLRKAEGLINLILSYGSGAAMRVPPMVYWYNKRREVVNAVGESSRITHPGVEAFLTAQNLAAAMYRARMLNSNELGTGAKFFVLGHDIYVDPDLKVEQLNWPHEIDLNVWTVVTHAAYAFFHGKDYEDTIRLAISIGGDSDTIANIAGSLAYAYYKDMPEEIYLKTAERLPSEFIDIIESFEKRVLL